jgi:hypothetical protein
MPAEIPPILRNNARVNLPPGTYPGDLVIDGNDNYVTGAGAGQTIILGSLRVLGDGNTVTDLTVNERSTVRGQRNTIADVEFPGGVARSGERAWVVPTTVVALIVGLGGAVFGVGQLTSHRAPATRSAIGDAGMALWPEWAKQTHRTTSPLFTAARGFVDDVAAGRHEAAYARMSSLYQKAVSLERFQQAVKAHPYLAAARGATVPRVSTRGGTGQATGLLQTTAGQVDVTFHCTLEQDGWRIAGITIAGAPALPLTGR